MVQKKRFTITKPAGAKHHHQYDPRLYPFLGISFFDDPPNFVVTEHSFTHLQDEPEICHDPCSKLAKENAYLSSRVRELEAKLAKAEQGHQTYP